MPIFQAMNGFNDGLTSKNCNSWREGKVSIGSVKYKVTPKLIAKAMVQECKGIKFVKVSNEKYQCFIDNFLNEGENLKQFQNGYNREKFSAPYHLVIVHIMK